MIRFNTFLFPLGCVLYLLYFIHVLFSRRRCQIKANVNQPDNVSIEHAQNDYTLYESLYVNFSPEEFGHVIEIYDFPAVFKTDDLLDAFAEHR